MPAQKKSRSPFGNIRKQKTRQMGLTVTVYDARKRYKDTDGAPKEKFKRCQTHSEAQIALQNFNNEIRAELAGELEEKTNPKQKTFLDLTAYFRREYLIAAKIVGGRIVEGYRQDIKRLGRQIDDLEAFFVDCPLSELSYEKIRQYKIAVSLAPKKQKHATAQPKPATVNRKLAILNRILNVGVQLGWMTHNTFRAGKPLIDKRQETARTRILTFEEERSLLDACLSEYTVETKRAGKPFIMKMNQPGERIHLIITAALDTAMRKSEILGLRREQIDLDNLVITLEPEQTKSFKARLIPVTERLEKLLLAYFDQFDFKEKERIFNQDECRRAFLTVLKSANIEEFRFHDLRATAITWMDLAGVSEMVKKNIAGHASGDVHQIYHRNSIDVMKETRLKLNEFRRKVDTSLALKRAA